MKTTAATLFDAHARLTKAALDLMKRKNHDYATSTGTPDALANFRLTEELGLCSTPQGILVRMSDKLRRLAGFAASDALEVKDESVMDTVMDLINYTVILACAFNETEFDRQVLAATLDIDCEPEA